MKKTPMILQNADLTLNGNIRLRELFDVVSRNELATYKEHIKGIVTIGGTAVNAELIEALPALKVISTRSVGFDHIDLEAARKRGIIVSNTPGVLSDCVADLAFGALIAISRQLLQADHFVRSGQWLLGRFPLTTKVFGKRLGIVGMGRIGQTIAKRASGFDMQVRYFSRSRKVECPQTYEPSLLCLAKWADYMVLCAPGGESTRNMISREILQALGPTSFIINVARGSLIEESVLLQTLNEGKIAGAVLDVFAKEPHVPKELIESNKVMVLPHVASNTRETFAEMEDLLIRNLQNYFTTGTLLTPV